MSDAAGWSRSRSRSRIKYFLTHKIKFIQKHEMSIHKWIILLNNFWSLKIIAKLKSENLIYWTLVSWKDYTYTTGPQYCPRTSWELVPRQF